jgi:hypothetical protein
MVSEETARGGTAQTGGRPMKLYNVRTTVKEYHGCKNVVFHWFYDGGMPTPRRPYAELIENYEPDGFYSEDYIDRLFTEDEASQLKQYLDREHGHEGTTTITEEPLPVANNMMSVAALAVGGGDDFYMLDKEPEYSLSFKVEGYFNLVGCELVDGSDVYHSRLWLVSKNGDMRQQTNEEAKLSRRSSDA